MIKRIGYSAYAISMLVIPPAHASINNTPLQLATAYDISQDTVDLESYWVSEKLDGIRARWTGNYLVTRNGTRIFAPDWFTEHWPTLPLDGELWVERGKFEEVSSTVLRFEPDERWSRVKFMVFDTPSMQLPFVDRIKRISSSIAHLRTRTLFIIPQRHIYSVTQLQKELERVTEHGGEGLMLHHKQGAYQNGRSWALLKLKQYDDDEARVIDHVKGSGKYENVMGALIVQTKHGVTFKLGTGFTDLQRKHPPAIGSWVTYKFYGKTRHGKPRFASFLHLRDKSDMSR